jgi:hypothetical protein
MLSSTKSPELNPTEECWRRLNRALGSQLFQTLGDLQETALAALGQLEMPSVLSYLCP